MMTPSDSSKPRNPVALVTGGTTGIGLVACQQLVAKGIDVFFTSRSDSKGQAAAQEVEAYATNNAKVDYVIMELSDLASVSKACDKFMADQPCLDYLLLNAGIMGSPNQPMATSANGIEQIVAVNHVAGFYMAHKLLPLMEATAPLPNVQPMITLVSSDLHNIHSPTKAAMTMKPVVQDDVVRFCSQQGIRGVDATAARDSDKDPVSYHHVWSYKFSKLLNVLTMQAIHEKLTTNKNSKVHCNSMEPGFIPQSDLSREVKEKLGGCMAKLLLFNLYHGPVNWLATYMLGQPVRTLEQGGASEVFAATQGASGKYYRLDEVDPPSPLTLEEHVVEGFYTATAELLREKGFAVDTL